METFYIPNENDFRKWIQESIKECLEDSKKTHLPQKMEEPLLTRKEMAKVLSVSLVTLNDWMKRGLPFHKQRGRVYFMRSEVIEHIKKNQVQRFRTRAMLSSIG